jgi:hypothetical protein
MLLAGASRDLVCNALVVTNRAIRKWINGFNQCGVDGLIVKKRPVSERYYDKRSKMPDI